MHDLIIIGAGPAGLSAAYRCQKDGVNYILLEAERIANTIYNYPKGKILFSPAQDLDFYQGSSSVYTKLTTEGKISREEVLQYFAEFAEKEGLNIKLNESVKKVDKLPDGNFAVETNKEVYQTKKVLLCIGNQASPRKLEATGEEEFKDKIKYRLEDPDEFQGEKILVVGGGDTAIETAIALSGNNEVAISYRKPEFFRLKENNLTEVLKLEKDGKIKIMFNSVVKEIKEREVILQASGQAGSAGKLTEEHLENDIVFVQIGTITNKEFLESMGLKIENHKIKYNQETLETNVKGIYIAGDLTKEPLIKNAIRHGGKVIEKMLEQEGGEFIKESIDQAEKVVEEIAGETKKSLLF